MTPGPLTAKTPAPPATPHKPHRIRQQIIQPRNPPWQRGLVQLIGHTHRTRQHSRHRQSRTGAQSPAGARGGN